MLYVKIENNEVKQVWDTQPPAGESGWKSAIEVRPVITAHRQGYTAHTFDLSKDPVEIVYSVFDIAVEDRKQSMKSSASFAFQQVVQEQMRNPVAYDPIVISTAQANMAPRLAAIEACTTHDELDALM